MKINNIVMNNFYKKMITEFINQKINFVNIQNFYQGIHL
jgi:hypothetical protein